MNCWKCTKQISSEPIKIGFRAVCNHCGADLHTCKNCRYHLLGKPNECLVPGTDFVRDREANNFCEEFKPQITNAPEQNRQSQIKGFHSLFKDEEK